MWIGVSAGGSQQGIGERLLMVVEVFATRRKSKLPQADHDGWEMPGETLVAHVAAAAGWLVAGAGVTVSLAQQQHAALTGQVPAAEIRKFVGNTLSSAVRGVVCGVLV